MIAIVFGSAPSSARLLTPNSNINFFGQKGLSIRRSIRFPNYERGLDRRMEWKTPRSFGFITWLIYMSSISRCPMRCRGYNEASICFISKTEEELFQAASIGINVNSFLTNSCQNSIQVGPGPLQPDFVWELICLAFLQCRRRLSDMHFASRGAWSKYAVVSAARTRTWGHLHDIVMKSSTAVSGLETMPTYALHCIHAYFDRDLCKRARKCPTREENFSLRHDSLVDCGHISKRSRSTIIQIQYFFRSIHY